MKIEINPRSLLNLEHIVEVLYKLHPYVLDYLVKMQRSLGDVMGLIDLSNVSLKQREFLADNTKVIDYLTVNQPSLEKKINTKSLEEQLEEEKANRRVERFYELRKYLQHETDEYIPMKIFVEIEDPVVGRKVKELVETLKKTGAPEQFYLNKKEIGEDAYFAEGYGLKMNNEQKKKQKEFFDTADADTLLKLLIKEKLYY